VLEANSACMHKQHAAACILHIYQKYKQKGARIFGGQSGIHACMSLLIRLICFIHISVSVAAGQMYIYLLGDKSLVRIHAVLTPPAMKWWLNSKEHTVVCFSWGCVGFCVHGGKHEYGHNRAFYKPLLLYIYCGASAFVLVHTY
jgi:hypothetical protein